MTKKLFHVEITLSAVVYAEDAYEAESIANTDYIEIAHDSLDLPINVTHEIKNREDLVDGWDTNCLPYGGDGKTTIGEYFPNLQVRV
jgi:hypothetical protein